MNKINAMSIQQLLIVILFCLGLSTWAYAQQEPIIEMPSGVEGEYTDENISEEQTEPEGDKDALTEAKTAAKEMAVPVEAYQKCANAVIGSDSPVADKRQQIDIQCQAQRQKIVEMLPEDLQEFMLLNMDRRVDMVLEVMEDAEDVIEDSAEDIEEAVDELSAADNNPTD